MLYKAEKYKKGYHKLLDYAYSDSREGAIKDIKSKINISHVIFTYEVNGILLSNLEMFDKNCNRIKNW